jgi:hypothetical protein
MTEIPASRLNAILFALGRKQRSNRLKRLEVVGGDAG